MQSVQASYSTPDTFNHRGGWTDKTSEDSYYTGGGVPLTPPPVPPKDAGLDGGTLTPPSSAFDSPSLRVSSYDDDDDNDDFQRYLAESYAQQQQQQQDGLGGLMVQHERADSPDEDSGAAGQGKLHRSPSIYSLSRTSFAAQLSRLTSLSMPLGTDLKDEIASLPSSKAAIEKLDDSYAQMQRWMATAKTVLQGMDAVDDVEWAAQGKQSLAEVDNGMKRFESLVKVYVDCIESIQDRRDIGAVEGGKLTEVIEQMDVTVKQWKDIQDLLMGVKDQVETAMEWTELWTSIMEDIQVELDLCINCVFECEEKRYKIEVTESADIDNLASLVGGIMGKKSNRVSPDREDMSSSLLGLFARMQPLRASLDFLPMRIAGFQARAHDVFPTACEDMEMRRESLEKKWKSLEKDAESLKKELSEDKWVAIFRNAGKQANKMMESVEKTINKVKVGTEGGNVVADSALLKLVESYETKRLHYGPAVGRVLSIIGKGMADRLTVNGEIIRLHSDLSAHWKNLEKEMEELDAKLATIDLSASHETLPTATTSQSGFTDDRSSISSMNSSTMAAAAVQKPKRQSTIGTPATTNTSPANSRLPRLRSTSASFSISSNRSISSPISSTTTPNKRLSAFPSLTTPKTTTSLLSPTTSRGSSPSLTSRRLSYQTPPSGRPTLNRKPSGSPDFRPRWNGSTNTIGNGFGHNFAPLTTTSPSPYTKELRRTSGIPTRSTDSSPLATRTPAPALSPALTPTTGKRYPPTSMKSKSSRDSFMSIGSAAGGRMSRNDTFTPTKFGSGNGTNSGAENSHGRAYAHVKSSGYGPRPQSAMAKSHPTMIPLPSSPPGSAGKGANNNNLVAAEDEIVESPVGIRTPTIAKNFGGSGGSATFAKRYSMPAVGKRPGIGK